MRQRYVVELPDFSVELVVEREAGTRLDRGQAKLVEDMIDLALDDLVEQAEDDEPAEVTGRARPECGDKVLVVVNGATQLATVIETTWTLGDRWPVIGVQLDAGGALLYGLGHGTDEDDWRLTTEPAPEPERAPTTMPPESGPTIPPPGSRWCVTCEALKNVCVTVLAPEPGDCVTCGEETRWRVAPARPPVDEALVQVAEQAAREHLRVDPDADLHPDNDLPREPTEEDTCDCTVLPRHGRHVIGIHHARGCRMWHDGSEALPPEPEGRGSKVIPWAPPEDAPAKAPVDDSFPF